MRGREPPPTPADVRLDTRGGRPFLGVLSCMQASTAGPG